MGINGGVLFLDAREKISGNLVVRRYAELKEALTALYDAIEGNPDGMKGEAFAPLSLIMLKIEKEIGVHVRAIEAAYKLKEEV